MEIRTGISKIKVNKKDNKVSGYAIKWDSWSQALCDDQGKTFYERFRQGAFLESLKNRNQKALYKHDSNYLLGAVRDSTFTIREDEIGLYFTLILPDDELGNIIHTEVKEGNLKHASISFLVDLEGEERKLVSNTLYRTIKKAKLIEISLVNHPAYLDSIVLDGDRKKNIKLLHQIDKALSKSNTQKLINKINDTLQRYKGSE